jgi:hypothetical protein
MAFIREQAEDGDKKHFLDFVFRALSGGLGQSISSFTKGGAKEFKDRYGVKFNDFINSSKKTEYKLFVLAWYQADNRRSLHDWQSGHSRNEALENIYAVLSALGYMLSDEEREMLDGTHEAFWSEPEETADVDGGTEESEDTE